MRTHEEEGAVIPNSPRGRQRHREVTCPGLRGHSWDLNPRSPGLRFQTYTIDYCSLVKHLLCARGWGHSSERTWEWGQGSSPEASGRRTHGESTQRLSSLDPCLGRCLPAAHLRPPRRPRALRAQDQAADPEAEAPSPEDALPAARGPQAALCPQPAPRPGAAAGRLWPGRALQEGQDEEEDVKKMAQPRLLPAPSVNTSTCSCVPLCAWPCAGRWGAPCRATAHEKECCRPQGSSCLC